MTKDDGGRATSTSSAVTGPRLILTRIPWLATAYLASYLVLGPVLFAFVLVILVVSAVVNITWLGLPIAIGAALLVRGCATIERHRARLVRPPIEDPYRPVPTEAGILSQTRIRWTDPATLRDCAYLLGLFPLLLVLDFAGLLVWFTVLALISLPAWYWMIPQTWPNGETGRGLMIGSFPEGPGGGGIGIWVGDIGTALLVCGFAVALAILVAAPLVTAVARLHAGVTNRLLGPPVDPLAEARRVLAGPGPLPGWGYSPRSVE